MWTYAVFLYTLQKGYTKGVWRKNKQKQLLKECDSQ